MIIGNIDTEKEVFVIAEAGNNHEGDFQKALDLVDAAAESGAHAIKFQTIIPDKLVSPLEIKRIEQLKRFQFSMDQFAQLKARADQRDLQFLSTPFALEVVDGLNELVTAFKIASGDLTWHDLIRAVAKKGKPVLLSTGAARLDEIQTTIQVYETAKGSCPSQIALLHCVMAYPAPAEALNLNVLRQYKNLFSTIGYSDHYLGIQSCVAAVALGARIIEKHFTLDKQTSDFRDHQLSANPVEMKQMTNLIKEIAPMLGHSEKELQACEKDILTLARRSPKAKSNLSQGHVIKNSDILVVRPNSGLCASTNCIGKTLSKDTTLGSDLVIT